MTQPESYFILDKMFHKPRMAANVLQSMLLSTCFCGASLLPFRELDGASRFHFFGISAGLIALWWDDEDAKRPHKGIPGAILYICLLYIHLLPSFEIGFVIEAIEIGVAVTVLGGLWFSLFLGFMRMMSGFGTAWWTWLFNFSLVYVCAKFCCLPFSPHYRDYMAVFDCVAIFVFFLGLANLLGRAAYCLYCLMLWLGWTFNMMRFMVLDVVSMLTFSVYCFYLTPPHGDNNWSVQETFVICFARVCLCTGWALSLYFIHDFCHPVETHEEKDKILQKACKISVVMDVGGKVCTSLCVVYAKEPHLPKWLFFLEFMTTLAEAMQKYAHAARAHARETSSSPSMSSYLLADEEP